MAGKNWKAIADIEGLEGLVKPGKVKNPISSSAPLSHPALIYKGFLQKYQMFNRIFESTICN